MKRLSILVIAALLIVLAVNSTKTVKANTVEIDIHCGCTSTPSPSPTITPTPTISPTPIPSGTGQAATSTPKPDSFTTAGPPICPATMPDPPIITSVVRKSTSATLTWTKVTNADHYLIFYGTKPNSQEFGVPDTGNVTTYTINALNPKLKYYFDVRSVNSCMPSNPGPQVLGASTTVLAATSSDMTISRIALGIIAAGVFLKIVKKYTI